MKGILIALFVIGGVVLLSLGTTREARLKREAASRKPIATPVVNTNPDGATGEARQLVQLMIKQGLVRIDIDQRQAWVSPQAWLAFDARAKKGFAVAVAAYVSPQNPMVTIYDAQSAREIANYGPFQGFRVK